VYAERFYDFLVMIESSSETATTISTGRARLLWIPLATLAAAAGWCVWQWTYARYLTFDHLLVALAALVALSIWYRWCGGGTQRTRRRVVAGLWIAIGAFFVLFRPVYNGAMGIYGLKWRWTADADEKLRPLDSAAAADDWQMTPRDYPGFLGGTYWAEVRGIKLETNWTEHPPEELWRREIGGGWSSFAIVGEYAVTQEQRGEQELVSCYRLTTGEPVWTHADETRFDPADFEGSLGGIGPRATPTIVGERIYTQGGTGIVNCLDARTGRVIWSHDTAEEFGAPVAVWGKSGSPLVVDDMVVISVGAPAEAEHEGSDYDSSLVAFDAQTGEVRWAAGKRAAAYATPVLATLAGERQIIVVNESWVTSHRVADGEVLWEHPWAHEEDHNASCPQPIPLDGDRVFLSKGYGTGASLLKVVRDDEGRSAAEPLWSPAIRRVMKTKFSNVVIRDGFVYGLDDVLLECIELETGKIRWKKRRNPEFGHGQILLVGETILVLSESGELALVEATPDEYHELASMQVLSDANVTWNNPAFSPPYLLVRNAREAACYRLPVK
jgi:outer membrane protein assembly factor BamB